MCGGWFFSVGASSRTLFKLVEANALFGILVLAQMGGCLALAAGGLHEALNRCPRCGAGMEYLGRSVAYLESGGISALFEVYVCSSCLTVQLVSFGNERAYRDLVRKNVGPSSFLKPCVSCGSRIPIASEECQFCGSKQPPWDEAKRGRTQAEQALMQKLAEIMRRKADARLQGAALSSGGGESAPELEAAPQIEVKEKPGECMVCHSPVLKKDDVITCPHCGGVAHRVHMLEWLHVKGTCPACHQPIAHP